MADAKLTVPNRIRFGLAVSILAGVVAFGWFLAKGDGVRGVFAFLLFAGAGAWDYHRQMQCKTSTPPWQTGGCRSEDGDRSNGQ